MKRTIIISSFVLANLSGYTQGDTHYSQFYSMPLLMNPATAGVFEGTFRMNLDYRRQWASITTPWKTMAAGADFKFGEDELSGNFFNGGVLVYNDNAGDSQFKTGLYNLAFGYTVHIQHGSYFTAAIQGGLVQNSINYNSLYWETQYNGYEFDNGRSSMENEPASASFTKGDLSLGVYYFNAIDDKNTIFFGASGNHLLAHRVNFTNIPDRIYRRVTAHGGAQFIVHKVGIVPNFLVAVQGPNRIINIGSDVKYWIKEQSNYTGFNDEISAGIGAYYRVGDAILLGGRFSYAGFTLAGSYDFNVSGLSPASLGKGGLEMLLTYRASFGQGKGRSTKFL